MPVSKLQNQVASYLEAYLPAKLLVAVSGGRDSVVLLHILVQTFPVGQLVVAHMNHQLRGAESNEDAKFVRELAQIYGCEYMESTCDVAQLSQQEKVSIEVAARRARQRFFAQAQAYHYVEVVLLAHHADDQAETILFNLLRGSVGLKGMRSVQQLLVEVDNKELKLDLLRPLLSVRRSAIEEYQQEYKLGHREDSSNAETVYTRNRVRHEVFPLLEEVMQRDVKDKILNSYYLTNEEEVEMLNLETYTDKEDKLVVSAVLKLGRKQQQELIKLYLENQGVIELTSKLILAAVNLLTDLTKPSINLPKGGKLRRKEKRIWVEKNKT